MGIQKYLVAMLLFTGCIFASSYSFAVCTNNEDGQPGQNGEMEYFTATNQLMYCDDTNWVEMVDPNVTCTSCGGNPDERVVFVTNGSSANMGGISGADANCQSDAVAAGLSGTYKAWLADTDPNSAPIARFEKSAVKYVRVTGIQVADNWQDLTDGTLDNSIALRANGTVTTLNALHTNVLISGAQKGNTAADTCDDWSAGGVTGNRGRDDTAASTWTDLSNVSCGSGGNRPYCFEQQSTKEDRLLAHWKLDETSGSTIEDSASINTGIWDDDGDDDVSGETVAGQVGNALTFGNAEINAGSDDTVDNLYSKGGMSVCAWIYPDSVPGAVAPIIVKNGTVFGDYGWSVYLNKAGGQTIEFYTNLDSYIAPNVNYALDTWQHICFTWDGSEGTAGLTSYVNGVEPSGTTYLGDDSATVFDDSTYDVRIGYDDSGSTIFDGFIDDVRIYNRVISAADVADIYNGANSSGLVAHLALDESDGSPTAVDSSGTGNDGVYQEVVSGNLTYELEGVFGTSVLFGNRSAVEVPHSNSYGNLDQYTISVWLHNTGAGGAYAFYKNDEYSLQEISGDQLQFLARRWGTQTGQWRTPAGSADKDGFFHVAITYDLSSDANDPIIYIDGEVQSLTENSAPSGSLNSSSDMLVIGNIDYTSGPNEWGAEIDDFRIYNYILTPSEIARLVACTKPGSYFYNAADDVMQWCDDAATIYNMGPPASGSGGCTGGSEGSLRYNTDRYQFCDGSGWVDIGK